MTTLWTAWIFTAVPRKGTTTATNELAGDRGSLTLTLAVRTKGCLACLPEALQPLLQTDFLWALLSFRNTFLYLNHRSGSSHSQKNRLFPMYEKVNSESKLVHQSFRIWASPPRATN